MAVSDVAFGCVVVGGTVVVVVVFEGLHPRNGPSHGAGFASPPWLKGSSLLSPSSQPGSAPSGRPSPSLSKLSLQLFGRGSGEGSAGGDALALGLGLGEGSGASELSLREEQPGSAKSILPSLSSSLRFEHWVVMGEAEGEGSGAGAGSAFTGKSLGEAKGNSSGTGDPAVRG